MSQQHTKAHKKTMAPFCIASKNPYQSEILKCEKLQLLAQIRAMTRATSMALPLFVGSSHVAAGPAMDDQEC